MSYAGQHLTAEQVAQFAYQAGFRGNALITAVAVSHAETAEAPFDSAARGDVGLEDDVWGPSIGLWQIRSLRKDNGTGRVRDEYVNLDPATNARHAYAISAGGTNWKPWSTYNNGAYKAYLAEATAAARAATSGLPAGTSGISSPAMPSVPIVAINPTNAPAVNIRIGGRLASGELGDALIGGQVDLTFGSVSEVQLQLEDRDYALYKRFRLSITTPVDMLGLRFSVVEFGVKQGDGAPVLLLKCHPEGVVAMRTVSPGAANDITPTDYMAAVARASGLRFVGELSGVQPSIGPTQIQDPRTHQLRPEYGWEIGQRLANVLGFECGEAGGVYYFGTPEFLLTQGQRVAICSTGLGYPADQGLPFEALAIPDCNAARRVIHQAGTPGEILSQNADGTKVIDYSGVDYLDDVTIRASVSRDHGEALRPAMNAIFGGAGPFDGGRHLLTRVSWSLKDRVSPVSVEAGTITKKVGTGRTTADDVASSNGTQGIVVQHGTMSALDFVTYCLRQVGDKYVYGAKDSWDDPNPTSFDCSSLVQWAAAQVGVLLPRTAGQQFAAVQKAHLTMTVAEAARTRGAILFRAPGAIAGVGEHIVVSLGDGKHTVEARGTAYGVIEGPITGRTWTGAGKLPGMSYG